MGPFAGRMAFIFPLDWWPWALLFLGVLLFAVYVVPALYDFVSPVLARLRNRRP